MTAFHFNTVPKIIFASGAAAKLGETAQTLCAAGHVMLITDKGVLDAGLTEGAVTSLKEAGYSVDICSDVVADPPESVVLALADRAAKADLVIGLGGGSSLDAAKLAAVLGRGEQPLADMYGVEKVSSSRLPLILIPTTSGTGSEVTPIAIVTTGETTKMGVSSSVLLPDIAVLDASLTRGLPAPVTAATGVDAMVHAIEAYTSAHKKNPISDALAIRALSLLADAVPRAYRNGDDMEARENALLGAMLAGQAFANAPVAAVHALAYPLGGVFHLPHGLSNALVLPHVLSFNLPAAETLYAELCPVIAPNAQASGAAFVDAMTQLCDSVGLYKKLRDFNISHNDLPRLAEDAMLQTRLLVNNPREVTQDDALKIYEQAW